MSSDSGGNPALDARYSPGFSQEKTAISAHRGGAGLWPENSLTAFRQACALPVQSIEFDVHPTADGRIVVHHDPVLGRVVEGEGAVCAMTWDAVSRLRFKDHPTERIPLLEEMVEIVKPSALALRLELKVGPDKLAYPGIAEAVLDCLASHGMLERTMVSSFDTRFLETVAALRPALHRIWLIRASLLEEEGLDTVIDRARTLGIPEIDLRIETIQDGWPQKVSDAGLALGAYAANDGPAIERAFALGVAMFTTDRPDLAIAVRDGL